MSFLTVIIKGDKFTAARCAADRNIPAAFVCELQHGRETVVKVSANYTPEVSAWLAETGPDDIIPGIGYAPGSCLLYTMHREAA